ncbi:DNA segregation ATPase FtsK/SpoIIIE, S-DNA-T family [Parageobacillus thermantarcticus]|uniref:DNA segregation ATPase FtsK/SpoIIIE, S-DNA-T family n=1 Tax=Parageobacillus thermantarcticus TaxID=186116 RepID=A0A1I0SJ71_9BACL|nr:DNA translocase FtsK [Parageobacillus thermantarcticus]SFA39571.1 DNA segregation ATPase FtsK/SpoIIIE, S-DNA-T family [Parageobacillus thermantarcticus]
MKWLKRFVRYLLEAEEEEQYVSARKKQREKLSSSQLDVKVAYQYPKGNFRFPLIPDEPAPERRHPSFRQEHSVSYSDYLLRHVDENQQNRLDDLEKKPFRPSDVPSPIYGYKRVTKKNEHAVEWVLPPHSREEETDVLPSVPKEKTDEISGRAPSSPERLEESEEMLVNDAVQEKEEAYLPKDEGSKQDEAKTEEKETNLQEAEKEEAKVDMPENNDYRTSKPARSRIPYNVMMLKQDRKKWEEKKQSPANGYAFPPLSLLERPRQSQESDEQWVREQCARLNRTFASFHIGAKVVHTTQGPTVTRFEVQPDLGVKVSKITNLADDIKLNLAAKDIRIEAPIPGKSTIGIEVPNLKSRPVFIREILESDAFRNNPSPLTVALGLDISGTPVVTDLKKMPHGLIAGATGSGKSVCINAMIVSLLYKAAPHEVKMLLIDPKMVELAPYNDIPHLVSPVITDVKAATGALKWAVEEMERRYELFAHTGVRDIQKYNELVKQKGSLEHHLPYIVIIIDELADLMMVAPADVEEAICRIAQKARACGIHLVVATQRPSVDVITGLIKANIPTRIAFSVSSQVDSRTIIDVNGAEKLLGRGDMLFLENGSSKTVRVQGNFVSDEEIERVVAHVKAQMAPSYLFQQDDFAKKTVANHEEDELFYEACEFVVQQGGASTSSLQRHFRIGYNRAARLIEMMEEQGIVSEARGSKPRDVLITEEELANLQENSMI